MLSQNKTKRKPNNPKVDVAPCYKINKEFSNLLILLPSSSNLVWVLVYTFSRGFCHSEVEMGSHWLPWLSVVECALVSGAGLGQIHDCGWGKPSINCCPYPSQWAGVAWTQLSLSPSFSLVGPWLLPQIDACSRRAVNSILRLNPLNPIYISESAGRQDVRSHTVSREIFLWTTGTEFKKKNL